MSISRTEDAKRLKSIRERPVELSEEVMAELARGWTDKTKTTLGEWSLHSHQAFALETIATVGGGILPMTVGAGKTLTALLAPLAAGVPYDKTVVLVPPELKAESLRELETYRQHFNIPEAPHYVSYSILSTAKGVGLLETLAPSLIVADEAQCLKDSKSNRTSRFMRYMKKHPETKFVAMSATFSAKTVDDFAHLSQMALKGQSPLPLSYPLLQTFSRILDPKPLEYPTADDWYYFWKVFEQPPIAAQVSPTQIFGDMFKRALGVVVTEADSCDMSMTIKSAGRQRPELDAHIRTLQTSLVLPCGQEVDTPVLAADKMAQLSQGFYLREVDDGRPPAYKSVRKKVRQAIAYHVREGVTETMVEEAFRAGTLPCAEPEAWDAWERKWRLMPEPETEAVWLTDAVLLEALEDYGGLVWYRHRAVRERIRLLGYEAPDPGERPTAQTAGLSIQSHGKGFNLQAWNRNTVLYVPAGGGVWQQMLGRTHRQGQKQDVAVYVFQHTKRLRDLFSAAMDSARFLEETQGLEQKLIKYGKVPLTRI